MQRKWLYAILVLMFTVLASSTAFTKQKKGKGEDKGAEKSRLVNLQIPAINDIHGNIATSSGSFGGVGRADFLLEQQWLGQPDRIIRVN